MNEFHTQFSDTESLCSAVTVNFLRSRGKRLSHFESNDTVFLSIQYYFLFCNSVVEK